MPQIQITNRKEKEKMARKPMVTRTVTTTKVIVLCMDVDKCEPFNKVVTLPRTFANEKKLMKAVEDVVNVDNVKAVHIASFEEVNKLYGMEEQYFIDHATELDPETRKALENEEATAEPDATEEVQPEATAEPEAPEANKKNK